MAKKKEDVEVVAPVVAPITQEFSNGDLNVLRDKINELIAELSKQS